MAQGHYLLRAKWMEVFYPETGNREIVSMISNYDPAWVEYPRCLMRSVSELGSMPSNGW